MMSKLKIGILGTRGIPNAYGGFEQFAEYLSAALVKKGHEVWVYNSSDHPYQNPDWNGVQIVHCKDWEEKIGTAGQFIYDYNCFSDARNRDFDILLQLGYTSSSIWYFRWPDNMIHIVNMDGLEWKRAKYGKWTKRFLKWAEATAAKHGDILVADSKGIQEHLFSAYGKQSTYIPYGASVVNDPDEDQLKAYELERYKFLLVIARIEPENNVEMIIKGYLGSAKKYPLVIVGNPGNAFGSYLRKTYPSTHIKYIGAIYNLAVINALRFYSRLYFHGHSVGGTNPSLLEAMGCHCNIAAHDNLFNKAILTDSALYFSNAEDITVLIDREENEDTIQLRKAENIEKVRLLYNWPSIIDAYENLFLEAVAGKISAGNSKTKDKINKPVL
jgi:glycosyltransferase involved in cell wall biosynthesis